VPTLVLWGRQDKILEPAMAARFEADLPDGRLVWVEECGHCAHLEAPDRAGRVVGAWVRGEEVPELSLWAHAVRNGVPMDKKFKIDFDRGIKKINDETREPETRLVRLDNLIQLLKNNAGK
jgi:hypothetical protein